MWMLKVAAEGTCRPNTSRFPPGPDLIICCCHCQADGVSWFLISQTHMCPDRHTRAHTPTHIWQKTIYHFITCLRFCTITSAGVIAACNPRTFHQGYQLVLLDMFARSSLLLENYPCILPSTPPLLSVTQTLTCSIKYDLTLNNWVRLVLELKVVFFKTKTQRFGWKNCQRNSY